MYTKEYPTKDRTDHRIYIYRSIPGQKEREIVERIPSKNGIREKYGDVDAYIKSRIEELSGRIEDKKKDKISVIIDLEKKIDLSKGDLSNSRNAGYLFLQKAYYDLGIDLFLSKWKFTSKANFKYSLNDVFRFLVYARVEDPGSKLALSRKNADYLEEFDFSVDDIYDCLDRIDQFSEAMTRKLSGKCSSLIKSEGDSIYYDCTNFYFEIQNADDEDGLRDYGVEKNHRPDPIVEYGLLMDEGGFPIGSTIFRGGESEKTSLVPLLRNAGEDITKAKIIVADNGLNCENNKKAIHDSGRNYIFCQSPKQLSEANLKSLFEDKDWLQYDTGKKVKSWWIKRTSGRDERLVARFDKASCDFMNKVIDDRVKRAEKFIANPSKLNLSNCKDGKQYIKKIVTDKKTGEVIKAKSYLELLTEEIEKDRKYAGYILYVTDIPRAKDDEDGSFTKMKALGYRVVFQDDLEIVKVAGRRTDIEDCFRTMKSGLDARPMFVYKKEHIAAHLFTVYVALTLLMYIKQKYVKELTNQQLLDAVRKYTLCSIGDEKDVYATGFYDGGIDALAKSMGFEGMDREYLERKTIKKFIAYSKKVS